MESLLCPCCNNNVEDSNHVFFTCNVALELWNRIEMWLDLHIPEFVNIADMFEWIDEHDGGSKQWRILNTTCVTVIWILWMYRNSVVFDGTTIKKHQLFDMVKKLTDGTQRICRFLTFSAGGASVMSVGATFYFAAGAPKPSLIYRFRWPGCSSMTGNFFELSPYLVMSSLKHNVEHLTLKKNPSSWNRLFDLLFLDNPIGTGFSIASTYEEIPHNKNIPVSNG
ncbi:serine carboxypeptidase-like 50 [Artemisia annua]|uniref:Serine carboxypeptidase-like 50 n=1 Tax=Artemisia annua TaxID=35608 RepID=A0A2U1LAY9_ARTAN|nr:serine carboxypeptidase-like 50 [Artemisia annua]